MTAMDLFGDLPSDALFELTPAVTRQLAHHRPMARTGPAIAVNDAVIRLDLPPWDRTWEIKRRRGGWPVIDPVSNKVRKIRPVWDALAGNARVHYAQRHKATKEVIAAVVDIATRAGLQPCSYMDVTLVWAPGHNRATDEDNRWPLLKACCDALARGPRQDLPGLHLLPDDDSRHMRKTVRIDPPPAPPGLYLQIVRQPL
jgi:crossover junction endodeoxyribonuclease RusA